MQLLEPGDRSERARTTALAFTRAYDAVPDAVGVAPGRVNLIGEHTDYNGGLCLPLALPHATWAAVRLRDDGQVRISSAQQEEAWTGSVDDLGPGASSGWTSYVAGVVWALGEAGHLVGGLDVHVDSTVPVGAGLSSSAALECSVAVAVAGALGLTLDDDLRRRLVAACVRAETEVALAPTGGMDQTVALLARPGHALLIDFGDATLPSSTSVPLDLEAAGLALLVTDTRVSHALVDGGYGDRRTECADAAAALGVASLSEATLDAVERLADPVLKARARHVVTENGRVSEVVAALGAQDWERVGASMNASHTSMRDDFEISCAELDLSVVAAVEAGALGARMTGGGFGGSSVALVPRVRLAAVAAAVDAAFAGAGYAAPGHVDAVPSDSAAVLATGS
jgi:galactokinase